MSDSELRLFHIYEQEKAITKLLTALIKLNDVEHKKRVAVLKQDLIDLNLEKQAIKILLKKYPKNLKELKEVQL